jgi:Leucine Rich Repeat (LRR) protein
MRERRVAWLALFAAAMVVTGRAPTAQALPPFFKEFQAKYVKADSADEKDKAFANTVTQTAKCNVCHVAGQDKKARNAYGKQLAMLLKKDNFKAERLKAEAEKCTAEIVAALDAVAAMKSAEGESPTFGELIAQGKLPGGDVKPADAAASTPAPAPAPAAPATPSPAVTSAPSPEVAEAIAKIQKIGGTVMALAMNDDSLVVDFHLGGTALNDEGLAIVKTLPKVVQLDLKDTQITDAGLANLAAIGTLNRLHLEKTKVTDAGLAHLKDLGNLEYLNLYGTAVTDAGLEHLKGLKNLKKLYVWQSQVTDAGIAKLKESLPGVAVVK